MEYAQFRDAAAAVQRAHPDVEISLAWVGPDEPVTLLVLRTLPVRRGLGLGEAALRDVIAMADSMGAAVRLTVEPITGDADIDSARLVAWYSLHGFVQVGEALGRPVMQRPPSGGSGRR